MMLLKSGQIINCCHPNALITLKEYLMDYASEETKVLGEILIEKELEKVTNARVKQRAADTLMEIKDGKRDFRF